MWTLPNILTLSRIPLLFCIVGLLFMDGRWLMTFTFMLFIAGSITDWLDGYLARSLNQITIFGKLMDSLADKVFVVGIFVGMLASPKPGMPDWSVYCVLLILSREFLITGLRLVAAGRGMVLAAEKAGKYKTASQMGAIGVLLASEALHYDFGLATDLVEKVYWVGIGLFVTATVLTVISGMLYLTKYWSVFEDPAQP
ncbi:MAG: CDP-diacylglycerol--glycerol-3-phosphate 3-phosphatidyltransferase [Verrucomicrobiota bacterium]